MYVTRRLSSLLGDTATGSSSTTSRVEEGPSWGHLVIQDEESEAYCCFGLCKRSEIRELPAPQNKELTVRYSTSNGENSQTHHNEVILIPVLSHPLSHNRYYAIVPHGKHKGEAYTNSREEDMRTFCLCSCIRDVKPAPLNPDNPYQQVQIQPYEVCHGSGYFVAKSVAPDGYPPSFLRRKGWELQTSTPRNFELEDALGIDGPRRARLPNFNFPLSQKSSGPVTVGKWYCPFMFIKDGSVRDQVKSSLYYRMTLEQRWEVVWECDREGGYDEKQNAVGLDCLVRTESVLVGGNNEAVHDERGVGDGFMWFRSYGKGGEETSVGLSKAIVERMKWEQGRVGWVGGINGEVRVQQRMEEVGWKRLGFYVLVERFVLRRMDGSLVLTYDFKHTHQIRSKWE